MANEADSNRQHRQAGSGADSRWKIERALRGSELSPAARHVALDLLTRTDNGSTAIPAKFTPSLTLLAHDTGWSRRAVMRALSELESGGWLVRFRDLKRSREEHQPTRYRLRLPAQATALVELGTQVPQARVTETLGLGSGAARARATVTPYQTKGSEQPLSRAERELHTMLAKLGATERETTWIFAKHKGDRSIRYWRAHIRASIANGDGPGLVEDARRELAVLDRRRELAVEAERSRGHDELADLIRAHPEIVSTELPGDESWVRDEPEVPGDAEPEPERLEPELPWTAAADEPTDPAETGSSSEEAGALPF
jgi:hypothetical protein